MRYFLLDRVTDIQLGKRITGEKCVTLTDNILHDHFPDHPIFPGALIIEACAQLAGMLLELTHNDEDTKQVCRAVLVQIQKMKFLHWVEPGDKMLITARVDCLKPDAAQVTTEVIVDEELKATGRLNFALMDIDSPAVTTQRINLYNIWTRNMSEKPLIR